MRQEPLVTVITVTYNSAKYVRDAIESVLNQTYKNIEYIIADDASTDSTWEIVNEYKDPRIISFRNEINLKEYPNRNKALGFAKGEYVVFIDGDDLIFPHGIETFVYYAKLFPEAGMIIQKGYFKNVVWPLLLPSELVLRNSYFDSVNFLTSSFASNFFRRAALEKIGGVSTEYRTGDEIIRLRIAACYSVAFIPGWLSWPRETPGQASASIPEHIQTKEVIMQCKELTDLLVLTGGSESLALAIQKSVKLVVVKKIISCFFRLRFFKAFYYKRQIGITVKDIISAWNGEKSEIGIIRDHDAVNPLSQSKLTQG